MGAEGTADMTLQDGFDDDNGIGFFAWLRISTGAHPSTSHQL